MESSQRLFFSTIFSFKNYSSVIFSVIYYNLLLLWLKCTLVVVKFLDQLGFTEFSTTIHLKTLYMRHTHVYLTIRRSYLLC